MSEDKRIHIERAAQTKIGSVDFDHLGFGKIFTDHMLVCDYADGHWLTPQIIPFQNLSMSPAVSVIHYGQTIFEGLKAFKNAAGEISIFRPDANYARMNRSATRLCMPEIPREVFIDGLNALLKIDAAWFPTGEGTSMYIRPFMFATDAEIRVKPSDTYRFIIIISPSGAYYSEPVKLIVEKQFVRASNGGLGAAKTAANYAASLYPAKLAAEKGYQQLIWTDSKEHKYIEEAGTMNFMFVLNGVLVTPELGDSILPGITRDSILQLAKDWGMKVEERRVAVAEIIEAIHAGTLQDAFGAGTAATVSHISHISNDGIEYELPEVSQRVFSNKVAKELNEIKFGLKDDIHKWVVKFKV